MAFRICISWRAVYKAIIKFCPHNLFSENLHKQTSSLERSVAQVFISSAMYNSYCLSFQTNAIRLSIRDTAKYIFLGRKSLYSLLQLFPKTLPLKPHYMPLHASKPIVSPLGSVGEGATVLLQTGSYYFSATYNFPKRWLRRNESLPKVYLNDWDVYFAGLDCALRTPLIVFR